jgi:uncharacterized RDD family membrane protein YckC
MQPCSCGLAHNEDFGSCPVTVVSGSVMQKPLIEPTTEVVAGGVRRKGRNKRANPAVEGQPGSSLIEFPGVSRTVPEWRKQLSQRVREVQEQRAREAAEAEAVNRAAEAVSCALPSGQLELVPDLEQAPMNPIVSKALERVDRARRTEPSPNGFTATGTAPAWAPAKEVISDPYDSEAKPSEVKPKLTIVTPVVSQPNATPPVVDEMLIAEPAITEGQTQTKTRPVRVISGSIEDAALSYVESCLSVPVLACDTRNDVAGLGRRTSAGMLDLLLIALMISPAAMAIELSSGNWLDTRVIGLMVGITVVTMFAYLTLSIALTGRTLSMRLFSLRTIDLRTGLIPTGGQAIRRSISYIFSLALLGLGLAYAFIDPDGRTVPDRFSHTIVIRD